MIRGGSPHFDEVWGLSRSGCAAECLASTHCTAIDYAQLPSHFRRCRLHKDVPTHTLRVDNSECYLKPGAAATQPHPHSFAPPPSPAVLQSWARLHAPPPPLPSGGPHVDPVHQCATTWAANLQCQGNDIRDAGVALSADSCCHMCGVTAGCFAWTWNREYDQHCWLKRSCAAKRFDLNTESGFMETPPKAVESPSPLASD